MGRVGIRVCIDGCPAFGRSHVFGRLGRRHAIRHGCRFGLGDRIRLCVHSIDDITISSVVVVVVAVIWIVVRVRVVVVLDTSPAVSCTGNTIGDDGSQLRMC